MKALNLDTLFLFLALGVGFIGGRMSVTRGASTPATAGSFDAQARAYVDSKLAAIPNVASCSELPKLMQEVTDIESKLDKAQRLVALTAANRKKNNLFNEGLKQRHDEKEAKLAHQRQAELKRLKQQIAGACAAVAEHASH